jgi:hypothetical protein
LIEEAAHLRGFFSNCGTDTNPSAGMLKNPDRAGLDFEPLPPCSLVGTTGLPALPKEQAKVTKEVASLTPLLRLQNRQSLSSLIFVMD